MLILSHADVLESLPPDECERAMTAVLAAHARGEAFMPLRSVMFPPGAAGLCRSDQAGSLCGPRLARWRGVAHLAPDVGGEPRGAFRSGSARDDDTHRLVVGTALTNFGHGNNSYLE